MEAERLVRGRADLVREAMGNPLFAILEQRIVKVLSYGIHGQPSAAWLPDTGPETNS